VLASRGVAWAVWLDPRQNGLSVWGNYIVYEPTDITDGPKDNLPTEFTLSQNYPNPFNPSTAIEFSLPRATVARVEIFNALGQRIAVLFDGPLGAGNHKVMWNGLDDAADAARAGCIYIA